MSYLRHIINAHRTPAYFKCNRTTNSTHNSVFLSRASILRTYPKRNGTSRGAVRLRSPVMPRFYMRQTPQSDLMSQHLQRSQTFRRARIRRILHLALLNSLYL